MRVVIDHTDGHWSFDPVDQGDGEIDAWRLATSVKISEKMWEEYLAFLELSADWANLIKKIDNETWDERQRKWAEYERKNLK